MVSKELRADMIKFAAHLRKIRENIGIVKGQLEQLDKEASGILFDLELEDLI